MEFCKGGDLFDYLKKRNFKLEERHAAILIHQIATAVYYLHSYGIVHRDLKPENIIMTDDTEYASIKLLDFGLGKILGRNQTFSDKCGSIVYFQFIFLTYRVMLLQRC